MDHTFMIIEYYEEWKQIKILDIMEVVKLSIEEQDRYIEDCVRRAMARRIGVWKYGFAIPNSKALKAIADLGQPILEIGAGLGYWSYLLTRLGVDVIATDPRIGGWNYDDSRQWTYVEKVNHRVIERHPGRVLMSIWPLNHLNRSLKLYTGDTLIWIGEECCDEPDWSQWDPVVEIQIPQWEGINDRLVIARRR